MRPVSGSKRRLLLYPKRGTTKTGYTRVPMVFYTDFDISVTVIHVAKVRDGTKVQ